jgi:hypothetical protein
MSRRRKQLLAAAGGALILAVLLVAVLAGGGSNGSGQSVSVPTAQLPTGTSDPHAQDRKQITALAIAYQNALTQKTSADPCNYFDPQSRAWVNTIAKHRYVSPISCATAAREGDVAGGVASGNDYPPGIDPTTIQFGHPNQQVRCGLYSPPVSLPASQQGLSWAIAGWAGANGNQVAVIKENGRWWIDVLLCHG